ncbi:MAG: 50S ribosomal protein L32 [Candidatus Paceibacterota bacterium]
MVVRMRINRSQTRSRRSDKGHKKQTLIMCPECGSRKLPHRACENCGMYKGKMVIDVNAQIERRERRRKTKLAERGEEESEDKKKVEEKK